MSGLAVTLPECHLMGYTILTDFQFLEEGDGMKRLWKKYADYITDKVIANYDTYVFGGVLYCLLGIADVGMNMYRHKTNLEDYWFGLSLLCLAIAHGCLLARAKGVRRLQDDETK
jgi:hypothetical protein